MIDHSVRKKSELLLKELIYLWLVLVCEFTSLHLLGSEGLSFFNKSSEPSSFI
jgi:hypothetical protein